MKSYKSGVGKSWKSGGGWRGLNLVGGMMGKNELCPLAPTRFSGCSHQRNSINHKTPLRHRGERAKGADRGASARPCNGV